MDTNTVYNETNCTRMALNQQTDGALPAATTSECAAETIEAARNLVAISNSSPEGQPRAAGIAMEEASLQNIERILCDERLSPRKLGAFGEQFAAQWLKERGWQILAHNWSSRHGELDIIMRERDDTLVFVEVKTRRTLHYGTPQEAITRHKQLNLRRTAVSWLSGPGRNFKHTQIRFDAISLWVHDGHVLVHWIPGAF